MLWTGFSEAFASITLTLFVPLSLAALGIVLRGSSFAFRKEVFAYVEPAQLRRGVRGLVGARAVLHGRGRGRDRVGTRARRRQGRRPVVQLDQPDVDPRRRARGRRVRVPRRGLPRVGRAIGSTTRAMVEYFRQRAVVAAIVAGFVAFVGVFVLHDDAKYVFDGLTSRALPLVIISALCGIGSLVLLMRDEHRGARLLAMGAVATVVVGVGRRAVALLLPTSLKVSQAAAPDATLATILVVFVIAAIVILPSLGLLYVLDQRSLLQIEIVEEVVVEETVQPEP